MRDLYIAIRDVYSTKKTFVLAKQLCCQKSLVFYRSEWYSTKKELYSGEKEEYPTPKET